MAPAYTPPPPGSSIPFPAAISIAGSNMLETGATSAPVSVHSGSVATLVNWPATPNARTSAFLNLLSFDNGLKLVQTANGITQSAIVDANTLNATISGSTYNPTFPNTTLANQLKM